MTREQVIEALKCCIVKDPDSKMLCVKCPYKDPTNYCLNRLKMDALALLEAMDEGSCGPDYCEIEEGESQ